MSSLTPIDRPKLTQETGIPAGQLGPSIGPEEWFDRSSIVADVMVTIEDDLWYYAPEGKRRRPIGDRLAKGLCTTKILERGTGRSGGIPGSWMDIGWPRADPLRNRLGYLSSGPVGPAGEPVP